MTRRGARAFKPPHRRKGIWALDAHPSGALATAIAPPRSSAIEDHLMPQAAGNSATEPEEELQTKEAEAVNVAITAVGGETAAIVSIHGQSRLTVPARGLRASRTAASAKKGNSTATGASKGTSALPERRVLSTVSLGNKAGMAAAEIVATGLAAIAEKKVPSATGEAKTSERTDIQPTKVTVAAPIGVVSAAVLTYEGDAERSRADKLSTETQQTAARVRTVSVEATVSAKSAEAAVQTTTAASTVANRQEGDGTLKRLRFGVNRKTEPCSAPATVTTSSRKNNEQVFVGGRKRHTAVLVGRQRPEIVSSKLLEDKTVGFVAATAERASAAPAAGSPNPAAGMTVISTATPNSPAATTHLLKAEVLRAAAVPIAENNGGARTLMPTAGSAAAHLSEEQKASKTGGDTETNKALDAVEVAGESEAGSNTTTTGPTSATGAVQLVSTGDIAAGRTGGEGTAVLLKSSAATGREKMHCQETFAIRSVAGTGQTSTLHTGSIAAEWGHATSAATAEVPSGRLRGGLGGELLSQKRKSIAASIAKNYTAGTAVKGTAAVPENPVCAAECSGRAAGLIPPYLKWTNFEELCLGLKWHKEDGSLQSEKSMQSSELICTSRAGHNGVTQGVDIRRHTRNTAGGRAEENKGTPVRAVFMLGSSWKDTNAADSTCTRCRSSDSTTTRRHNSNTDKNRFDKRSNSSDSVCTNVCDDSVGACGLVEIETEARVEEGKSAGYCRRPSVRQREGNWQTGRKTYSMQQAEQEKGRKEQQQQRSKDRNAVFSREPLQAQPSAEKTGLYSTQGEKHTRLQLYRKQAIPEEQQQPQQHNVQNSQEHLEGVGVGNHDLHQQNQGQKDNERPLHEQSQAREDEWQKHQVPQPDCGKYTKNNLPEEYSAHDSEKVCNAQVNINEQNTAISLWREREFTKNVLVTESTATDVGPTAPSVAASTAIALRAPTRPNSATGSRTIATTIKAISLSSTRQSAPSGTISGASIARAEIAAQRPTAGVASKTATITETATGETVKTFEILEKAAHVQRNTQTAPQSICETPVPAILQTKAQENLTAPNEVRLSDKQEVQLDTPLKTRKIEGVDVAVTLEWLSTVQPIVAEATDTAGAAASRRAIAAANTCRETVDYVKMSLSYTSATDDEDRFFRLWQAEGENAIENLSPLFTLDEPYEWEVHEISLHQQNRTFIQQHLKKGWWQQEREMDEQRNNSQGQAGHQSEEERDRLDQQVNVTGLQGRTKTLQQKRDMQCFRGERERLEVPQTSLGQVKTDALVRHLCQVHQKEPHGKLQRPELHQQSHQVEKRLQEEHWQEHRREDHLMRQIWEENFVAFVSALPYLLRLFRQHKQRLKKKDQERQTRQHGIQKQSFLVHRDEHLEPKNILQDSTSLHPMLEHQQATRLRSGQAAEEQQPQQPYWPSEWWEAQSRLEPWQQLEEHTEQRNSQCGNEGELQQQQMPPHGSADADGLMKQKESAENREGFRFDSIRAAIQEKLSKLRLQQQETCLNIQPLTENAAALSKCLELRRTQQAVMQRQILLLRKQLLFIDQQEATLEKQRCQLSCFEQSLKLRQRQLVQSGVALRQHQQLPDERTGTVEQQEKQEKRETVLPQEEQVEQTIEQQRRAQRERQLLQAVLQHEHEEENSETRCDQQSQRWLTLHRKPRNLPNMQQINQDQDRPSLDEQQRQLLLQLLQALSRCQQQQYQPQSGAASDISLPQEEKRDGVVRAQQQHTEERFKIILKQQQQQRKENYACMVEQEDEGYCSQAGVLPQQQQQRADYLGSVSASLEKILIKLTSNDSTLNAEAEAHTDSVDPSTSTQVQQNLSTCDIPELVIPGTVPSAAASFATTSAAAASLPAASPLVSVLPAAPAAGTSPQPNQIFCQLHVDEPSQEQRQTKRQHWGPSEAEHEEGSLNEQDCRVLNSAQCHMAPIRRLYEATYPVSNAGAAPASSTHRQPPEHFQGFLSTSSIRTVGAGTRTHVDACGSGMGVAGCAASAQGPPVNLTMAGSSLSFAAGCTRVVSDPRGVTSAPATAAAPLVTARGPALAATLADAAAAVPAAALDLRKSAIQALRSGPVQKGEQRQNSGEDRSCRSLTPAAEKDAVYSVLKDMSAAGALEDVAAIGGKGNEAGQSETDEATAGVAVLLEAWDWSGVKAASEESSFAIEGAAAATARTAVTGSAPTTNDRRQEDGDTERRRGLQALQEASQRHQQQQQPMQARLAYSGFPSLDTRLYCMSKAPVTVERHGEDVSRAVVNAESVTVSNAAAEGKRAVGCEASFERTERQRGAVDGVPASLSETAFAAASSYTAKQQAAAAGGEAAVPKICGAVGAKKEAIGLEGIKGIEEGVDASNNASPWSPLQRCFQPCDSPAANLKQLDASNCEQQKLHFYVEKHPQQQHSKENQQQQPQRGVGDNQLQAPIRYAVEVSCQTGSEAQLQAEQPWYTQHLASVSLSPSAATPFSPAPLPPRPASDLVAVSPTNFILPDANGPPSYGASYSEEKGDQQLVTQSAKPVPSGATVPAGTTLTSALVPVRTGTAVGSQPAAGRITYPKTAKDQAEMSSGSCCGMQTAVVPAFKEENRQRGAGGDRKISSWSRSATDQQCLTSWVSSPLPPSCAGNHEGYESNTLQTLPFAAAMTGSGTAASPIAAAALPRTAATLTFPTVTLTPAPAPIVPTTSLTLALPPQAAAPAVGLPHSEAVVSPTTAAASPTTATALSAEAASLLALGAPLPAATSLPEEVASPLAVRSAGPPEVTALPATDHLCVLSSAVFTDNQSSCRWKDADQPQLQSEQGRQRIYHHQVRKAPLWQQQDRGTIQRDLLQQAERPYPPFKNGTPTSPDLVCSSKGAAELLLWHAASADSLFAAQRRQDEGLLQRQLQEPQQQRLLKLPSVPVFAAAGAVEAANQRTRAAEEYYSPAAETRRSEPPPVVSAVVTRSRSAALTFGVPMPATSPLVYTSDDASPSALPAPLSRTCVENRNNPTAALSMHNRGTSTTATALPLAVTPYEVLEQCDLGSSGTVIADACPRAHLQLNAPPPPPLLLCDIPDSRGPQLPRLRSVCRNEWTIPELPAAMQECSQVLTITAIENLQAPLQMGASAPDTLTGEFPTGLMSSRRPDAESEAESQRAKLIPMLDADGQRDHLDYRLAQEKCAQHHLAVQHDEHMALLQHQLQLLAAQQQKVTTESQQDVQQQWKLNLPKLQQTRLQQQEPQACSSPLEPATAEEGKCGGLFSFYRAPSLILQQYQQWQSEEPFLAAGELQQQPPVICEENRLNQFSGEVMQEQQQHEQAQEQPQQRRLGQDESEQRRESGSSRRRNNEQTDPYISIAPQPRVLTSPPGELLAQTENHAPPVRVAQRLCNQQAAQQRHADKVREEIVDMQIIREAVGAVDVGVVENNTGALFFRNTIGAAAAAAGSPRKTAFVVADAVPEGRTGRSQPGAGRPYNTWDEVPHRQAQEWYNSASTSKNRNSSRNAIAVCIGRVEEGPRTRSPMACRISTETAVSERHTEVVGMNHQKASTVRLSGAAASDARVQSGVRHHSGLHSEEGDSSPLSPLSKAENSGTVTSATGGTTAAVAATTSRRTVEKWNGEKSYFHMLSDYEAKKKARESSCNSTEGDRGCAALTEAAAATPGNLNRRAVYVQQQRLMRTRGQRFPCNTVSGRYIMHRQGGTGWREELPAAAPPPPPPLRDREAEKASAVGGHVEATGATELDFFNGAASSSMSAAAASFRNGGRALPAPPPRAAAAKLGINWSGRRSTSACPSAGRGKRLQQQAGETIGGGRHLPPYTTAISCRGSRQLPAQQPQNHQQQQYLNMGFGGFREYWNTDGKRQSSSHVEARTATPEYGNSSRRPRKGCTPSKPDEGLTAAADASAAKQTSDVSTSQHLQKVPAAATAAASAPYAAGTMAKDRVGKTLIERQRQESLAAAAATETVAFGAGKIEKGAEISAAVHVAPEVGPGGRRGELSCAAEGKGDRSAAEIAETTCARASKRTEGWSGSSSDGLTAGRPETTTGEGKAVTEPTEQQGATEASSAAAARVVDGVYMHLTAQKTGTRTTQGGRAPVAEITAQSETDAVAEVAADAARAAPEVEDGNKKEERQKEEKGFTTVMLRNIPNKYNRQQVMNEIDVHFKGTYDFFYLPIDFVHGCNVGYCFINFLDVATAEAFRQEFEGKRLNLFKSRKICSVTYGRVQGLKAILEHYFHSAVVQVQYASWRPVVLKDCVELPWSELHNFFPELFENKFPASSSSVGSPTKRDSLTVAAAKKIHRSSSLCSASSSSSFACASVWDNHPITTTNATGHEAIHASLATAKGSAVLVGESAPAAKGTVTPANQCHLQAHAGKSRGSDNGVVMGRAAAAGSGGAAGRPLNGERAVPGSEYGGDVHGGTAPAGAALQEEFSATREAECDTAARKGGEQQLRFSKEEAEDSDVQAARKDSEVEPAAGAGLHDAFEGTLSIPDRMTGGGIPGSRAAPYSNLSASAAGGSDTIETTGIGGTGPDAASTGDSLLLSRRLSIGRRRGRKLGVTIEARRRELRNLASKHICATNRFASYRETFAVAAASAARQRVAHAYSPGSKLRLYTKCSSNVGRKPDAAAASAAVNAKQTGALVSEVNCLPVPAPDDYTRTAVRILHVARCRGYINGGRSVACTEPQAQRTAPAAIDTTTVEGGARVVAGGQRAASATAGDGITPMAARSGVPALPATPSLPITAAEGPGGCGAPTSGRYRRTTAVAADGRGYLRRTAPASAAGGVPQQAQHYTKRAEGGDREDSGSRIYPERLIRGGGLAFNSKRLYNNQQWPSSSALHDRNLRLPGLPLRRQLCNTPERNERRTEVHEQVRIDLHRSNPRVQP